MSAKSLSLVFVTCFAFIMLVNGNAIIDANVENDIIVCPEGANGGCKTWPSNKVLKA